MIMIVITCNATCTKKHQILKNKHITNKVINTWEFLCYSLGNGINISLLAELLIGCWLFDFRAIIQIIIYPVNQSNYFTTSVNENLKKAQKSKFNIALSIKTSNVFFIKFELENMRNIIKQSIIHLHHFINVFNENKKAKKMNEIRNMQNRVKLKFGSLSNLASIFAS